MGSRIGEWQKIDEPYLARLSQVSNRTRMDKLIQESVDEIVKQVCDTYGVSEDTEDAETLNADLAKYVSSVAKRALVPVAEYGRRMQAEMQQSAITKGRATKAADNEDSDGEYEVDVDEGDSDEPAKTAKPEPPSKPTDGGTNRVEIRLSTLESKLDQVIRLMTSSGAPTTPIRINPIITTARPNTSDVPPTPYVPAWKSVV